MFYTSLIQNTSHSRNNWARYDQKRILVFTNSTRYSCPISETLEFSRQIFDKYPVVSTYTSDTSVVYAGW